MSEEQESQDYIMKGEKEFVCLHCDKEYKTKSGIEKHVTKCEKKGDACDEEIVEEEAPLVPGEEDAHEEIEPQGVTVSEEAIAGEPVASSGKVKGAVKWFDVRKGFGFITPADGGEDIFVHHTKIIAEEGAFRKLAQGHVVTYEIIDTDKGPEAINVVQEE